jgi:hypothetical protein
MAEKTVVNCVPTLWNNDAPPMDKSKLGILYRFPKTITILSLPCTTEPQKTDERRRLRDFKSARLVDIDKEGESYMFIGHKIINKKSACSKRIRERNYCFIIGFDEMKELTGELKGELAQTA